MLLQLCKDFLIVALIFETVQIPFEQWLLKVCGE